MSVPVVVPHSQSTGHVGGRVRSEVVSTGPIENPQRRDSCSSVS